MKQKTYITKIAYLDDDGIRREKSMSIRRGCPQGWEMIYPDKIGIDAISPANKPRAIELIREVAAGGMPLLMVREVSWYATTDAAWRAIVEWSSSGAAMKLRHFLRAYASQGALD